MTSDVEHLFSLLAIPISLVKCVVKSFGQFFSCVFLLLTFENSFYTFDTKIFSQMGYINIFFQSVACIFIF